MWRGKKKKKQACQPLLVRSREFLTKAAGLLKVGGLESARSILETSCLNGFQPAGIRTDQWVCSEGKQAAETGKQLNTRHTGGFSVLWTGFGRTWLGRNSHQGMNPGMLLAAEGIVTSDCNQRGSVVMKEHAWPLLHVTEFIESRVAVHFQICVFGGQFDCQGSSETLRKSWHVVTGWIWHCPTGKQCLRAVGYHKDKILVQNYYFWFSIFVKLKNAVCKLFFINSLEK